GGPPGLREAEWGMVQSLRDRQAARGAGMRYSHLITREPDKRGGQPCIRGLRMTVQGVLEYLAAGMSVGEILADFPGLTAEDIRACLAFAADRERRLRVVPPVSRPTEPVVNPMSTLVRRAVPSDVGPLIALSRRTISACYRPFLGDEAVDAFIGSGAADRYVEENIGRCSVLLHGGEIAGYAVCRENLIDLMMVDATAHRRGLGSELLRRIEEALLHRYDGLWLESFEANRPANAFYRK